jgi:cellulose synthase/poly-beta-1,6-N-acetylglucosamine synthase-like glycosyltransferase/peptidoglycan/xylan/chitin deacetylase (PgdA/CDA1 family)
VRLRRLASSERQARLRRRIRRPPAHWSLLGFCLFVLLVLLTVQGVAAHTTGRSGTPSGAAAADSPLAGKPPLLALQGGRLTAHEAPVGKRIALTFDDGPDPRWTPRIEAVLRRLHVPATFFVVGSATIRHPEIVRSLHEHGFELGNHTFSHTDLAAIPRWERGLQLGLTDNAVAGAAGVRPRLMRPPYSAKPADVTPKQLRAYEDVARRGYLIALSDFDARDWSRPGAADIVRGATPPAGRGGIVLMHDGGGDRSETVAALKELIPRLRARGYTFVRVSDLAGVSPAAVEPSPSGWDRARGQLLIATLGVAGAITTGLTFLLGPIAVLALLRMLLVVALARRHVRAVRGAPGDPEFTPPVSIVVPAFNEAVGIERAVRSLAAADYPRFEVVVVDDGSTDGTGELVDGLGLERVRVLRQPNAGKPAALNAGVRAARYDLIVTVDGDTVFEPGTLRALVQPFRDPDVGAAAGNTKVGNRGGLLGRWQHIEYVMGFNLDRRLYDVLRCMPTVPGAIGAFRREALTDIGGVSSATLAEDTDITIGIGRAGWRVVYAEEARAWTEAPASLSQLWRQRYRWSYGTMQAVWKHRAAVVHRDERRIGLIGLPYLVLFQIALPLLAPLIDVFAVYGLLFLDPVPVLAYWLGFQVLNVLLGWYAFRLDRESPRPLWAMPLQQFVYRQLMYLVVIESLISALAGTRIRWQRMERTGEVEVEVR